MKVTKDILQEFNIVSMSILHQNSTINCVLFKTIKNKIELLIYENLMFEIDSNIILNLNITYKENAIFKIANVLIEVIEYKDNILSASIIHTDDTFIQNFIKKLNYLDFQDNKYGRRKEIRLSIGKKNWKDFGLTDIEQKIFSTKDKIYQSCVIIDASFHGISFITTYNNTKFKMIDNFNLNINFSNPNQSIILQAHKVNTRINKTSNLTFATISCQLLEPINHIWKERIINLIENQNH